ncbi:unnamed protein product [Didymodactylos carnosus]|uniref:Major facilitator superfamily (MFS) profile domain-containing protein n=1 Tax=Didymodactylos carnosus TaxID=1234261 RepID=A0A813NKZ3_9BILA|nr:unnamed protein product [Didymodactylos carnosus]CAF3519638.1 unnamed protein product [Didymodactylos carnosus]
MSIKFKDNQDEYHFNYEEVQALFNSVTTSSENNLNQAAETSTTMTTSLTPARTTITYTPIFGGRSSTTRRSVRSRPPPPTYLNSSFFRHAAQTSHQGTGSTPQPGGTNTRSPFNYSRSFRSGIRSRGPSYRPSFDSHRNDNHDNISRTNSGFHDNITSASTATITGVIGGQPSVGSVTAGMSQVLAITTNYQPQPTGTVDLQRSTSVPNIIYLPATFALVTVNNNAANDIPTKISVDMSDTQQLTPGMSIRPTEPGGLLQTVFVCSYMALAPLFGYLGDRYSRKNIILLGVTLWSMTTVAGSFVPSNYFVIFVILRSLVGVGEASYSCVAPTIIGDLYKHDSRTKMLALFNIAVPLGSGLGYILGSNIAEAFGDWRWALRITPALGVVCVVLLLILVDEPVRGSADGAHIQKASGWLMDVKELIKIKSYVLSTLAFTWVSFTLGAIAWWAPNFLKYASEVVSGKEEKHVPLYFGIVTCVAGFVGVISGAAIARRFRKTHPNADPIVCGCGILCSLPFLMVVLTFSNKNMIATWICIFFAEALLCMNWALISDMLMYVVIPTRRSTAAALQIFASHLFGDASSPYIIGLMSDYFRKHPSNAAHVQNPLFIDETTPFIPDQPSAQTVQNPLFIDETTFIRDSDRKDAEPKQESSLIAQRTMNTMDLDDQEAHEDFELQERVKRPRTFVPTNEDDDDENILSTQPMLTSSPEATIRVTDTDNEDETTPFPVERDSHIDFIGDGDGASPIRDETSIRRRSSQRPSSRGQDEQNTNPLRRIVGNFWNDLWPANDRSARIVPLLLISLFVLFVIIVIIFVVMGYESVEYHQFAVAHNQMTGRMDLKNPYSSGVYILLPWQRFVYFDKTSRYMQFDELTVFTTDKASIILDAAIVYKIRSEQIEQIWLNFADKHEMIVERVAKSVIRNYGNQYSISDYRTKRVQVEYELRQVLYRELSGDCCLKCCDDHTCPMHQQWICSINNCTKNCTPSRFGYFIDLEVVYFYKIDLPSNIVSRLHTLMLKPIYVEIALHQLEQVVYQIETQRQRNVYLNKARYALMASIAKAELEIENAKVYKEQYIFKQIGKTEQNYIFRKLNITSQSDKLASCFLYDLNHLINVSQTVNIDSHVRPQVNNPVRSNEPFDFIPPDVFDLTEFMSILTDPV